MRKCLQARCGMAGWPPDVRGSMGRLQAAPVPWSALALREAVTAGSTVSRAPPMLRQRKTAGEVENWFHEKHNVRGYTNLHNRHTTQHLIA